MTDPRTKKLAKLLIEYSLNDIKKNDKFWLRTIGLSGISLSKEIYKLAILRGAHIIHDISPNNFRYITYKYSKDFQLKEFPKVYNYKANWADKHLSIVSAANTRELSNIDPKKIMLRKTTVEPIYKRLLSVPWCLFYYPTNSMAQDAGMSLDELEDFVFRSCLIDWIKKAKEMKKLKKILDNAKEIRVIGQETDLKMSFSGRTFKICDGKYNMPDGELFACPLENSTNGKIYYEFPSNFSDNEIKGIRLEFKGGKVVKASAENNENFLKKVLETDAGAKRLGEFAIGTNYKITRFMNNTLFDEKIGGTIHTALGRAFDEKEGGGKNKSAIHWDLVKDTRIKGSKVVVNDKEILKDGKLLV